MQAIEYMDLASMDMVRDMNSNTIYPFEKDYEHYVLIEVAQAFDPNETCGSSSESSGELESDRLYYFLETIEDEISDGVVSHDEKQLH